MAIVLSFLIRYFSNYYTLHRSDLAARAAPLDPCLQPNTNLVVSNLVLCICPCGCETKLKILLLRMINRFFFFGILLSKSGLAQRNITGKQLFAKSTGNIQQFLKLHVSTRRERSPFILCFFFLTNQFHCYILFINNQRR